jgi:hypothetical protein
MTASAQGEPLVSSSVNAAHVNHAKVLPSAKCVIASFDADEQTGEVSATGGCIRARNKVLPSWSYSYSSYDASGAVCGSPVKGARNEFQIGPEGFDRAVVRVELKAKTGRSNTASRSVQLNSNGTEAQCGKMVNLPSADLLCPWRPPQPSLRCGEPLAGVGWNTPPTLHGNVISAGHLVSRSGACWFSDTDGSGFIDPPINRPVSYDWLGYHNQGKNVFCRDHLVVRGGITYVEMINPAGQKCSGHPPRSNSAWSFQIPPSWGGRLYVFFTMSAFDAAAAKGGGQGNTAQTAVLQLSGSENGCSQLQPGWRP